MSHHRSDADIISHTHNTARYFTENPHVSLILIVVIAAIIGYGLHAATRKMRHRRASRRRMARRQRERLAETLDAVGR